MAEVLEITRFGNPILRKTTDSLTKNEILSGETQTLIENMYHTLKEGKYSVALAAPQVGIAKAFAVVDIKPTPSRPDLKPIKTVLINPEITKNYGKPVPMWEGCVSCGSGEDTLYAQVPRHKKIRLKWTNERGKKHEKDLDGFIAHVAQHETDHLNGILFVDKVEDATTYMMIDEYKKRVAKK